MTRARPTAHMAALLAGLAAHAQEPEPGSGIQCRPDEADMGDNCGQLEPPATEEKADLRRVTPFRKESMMPGRVGQANSRAGQQRPPGSPVPRAVPIPAQDRVPAAPGEIPAAAPVKGDPPATGTSPDEQAAAAERLRIDHRVSDTYIKPLDNFEPAGLSNDATQE